MKNLNQYLDCMYTETLDSAFLTVKLNFLLDLRVGALVPKIIHLLQKVERTRDYVFMKSGERLGHSSLNTTLGYICNPLTEKETYDLISKAL